MSAALVEDDFEIGAKLEEIQTTTVVAALAGDWAEAKYLKKEKEEAER